MSGESYIEGDIAGAEEDAGDPGIADAIEGRPGGVAVAEGRFGFQFVFPVIEVDVLCLDHQAPDVFYEMGRVGIFLGVAVGVMHPVEDRIGPGIEEGGTLGEKGERVKEFLPESIHLEHLMRRVPMQEERLRK